MTGIYLTEKKKVFFIVMKCIESICQPVTGDAADSVSVKNNNVVCPQHRHKQKMEMNDTLSSNVSILLF